MSDWVPGRLSDVIASLNAGVSVNSDDRMHGAGEIGVLKTSALSGGQFHPAEHKTVKPEECNRVAEPVGSDSVLISRMNTPSLVGEACYVPVSHPSLFLPDRIWQVEPSSRRTVSMRWLSFILRSADFRRHVDNHATGTSGSMKNLPKAAVKAYQLLFPSFEEQVCIAHILDTLDTQIEKTQALVAKLEQAKEGLLHDLLTRGVDENGELRSSPEEARDQYLGSEIGFIPRSWTVLPLGECAEIVSGITLGSQGRQRTGLLVPYLRVANVQDGHLDLADLKYIRASESELQTLRLRPGDVLMNEGGDFDKLGRGAVWQGQLADCIHQNHVFRVRSDSSMLLPEFLAAFAASHAGKSFFIRASKQSTNLASINSTQLKAMPIPIAPIAEQRMIVEKIRAIGRAIQQENVHQSGLVLLKSGLMDDLLTGRVRVTLRLEREAAEAS